jgi:hypothetical protein
VGGGDDDDESSGGGLGDDSVDEGDGAPGFVAEEEQDYILFAEREFEDEQKKETLATLRDTLLRMVADINEALEYPLGHDYLHEVPVTMEG